VANPEDVVRRLGGRARLCDLLAHVTRHAVRESLREGRLVRATRGLHALPDLPPAYQACARARGVLSHATAAAELGLALVRIPDAVHVTVPPGARPPAQEGVRVHWSRLGAHEVQGGITSPLRTVLDCAASLPFDEGLTVADSALGQRFLTPDRLVAAAAQSALRGRAARVRVAEAADVGAENAFESSLRAIVLGCGLTGFVPQLAVRLPRYTAHVDLGDERRRMALEADSFAHHGTRQALARDCERYDELVAAGWTVLRFAWEHVMLRPTWVADVVRRACAPRVGASAATHSSIPTGKCG
jgi:very-short-patch-repair endonuclease